MDSFKILESLDEVATISRVLRIIKAAGPQLEPINYDKWLDFCKRRVSAATFDKIQKDLV